MRIDIFNELWFLTEPFYGERKEVVRMANFCFLLSALIASLAWEHPDFYSRIGGLGIGGAGIIVSALAVLAEDKIFG